MAVDLIVSPLSKYWSGDYITPVMEYAWQMGVAYNVVTPQGMTSRTEGTPYGGEDAKAEREELVPFVEKLMTALLSRGAAGAAWDERSNHFGFHRVDPEAFGELLKRAGQQFTQKPGLLGRLTGRKETASHLGKSVIFLPITFDAPLDLEGKVFGSLPRAKNELETGDWRGIPPEALHPIIGAFDEAIEHSLPLAIDM
ncbi:hypothetical protein OKA05_27860 [Luteolibacter arcticus]|uniref:Uncharacterized protein n=1 Tax=Luteolibacter arcticus TaxID=1581411 RepID=A0ABT3GS90_9BACT|nr:hypothetical protein [Luteolibacter arcticus]MCW1926399.1 hypothetical protein [Luteolibacter arcticus]